MLLHVEDSCLKPVTGHFSACCWLSAYFKA